MGDINECVFKRETGGWPETKPEYEAEGGTREE